MNYKKKQKIKNNKQKKNMYYKIYKNLLMYIVKDA